MMNMNCPRCQAELELPDDAHGKKARCPSCEHVFIVGGEESSKQVQPGLPAAAPPPLGSSSEGADARPRRRRYADDEDDTDIADFGRDSTSVAAQAKAAMRPAGLMMLLATGALMLNFVVGVVMFFLTLDRPENQAQLREIGKIAPGVERAIPVMVPTCICLFYAPFLVFMLLGGRSLITLGSRGIIITGIVFSFIMVFLEGIGLIGGLSNLVRQNPPQQPIPEAITGMSMTFLCFVATLTAAIMAVRALGHPDVAGYYRFRFEEEMDQQGRRRRNR